MTERLTLWAAALSLFFLGLLPLVSMLVQSLIIDGRVTLSAYDELFSFGRQWQLLGNSLFLALLVALFSTFLGGFLGFLVGKCQVPSGSLLCLLFCIPFMVPPYILAVAWNELLSSNGILANTFPASFLFTLQNGLFSLFGAVLVLTTVYLPLPMLLVIGFLRTINPRLEEAARLCSSWPYVLRNVTIPLLLPGILFSFLLVFVMALGEYSVPAYLRFPVFPVEAFTQFSAMYDFKAATASSLPIALVALLVLMAEIFLIYSKDLGQKGMSQAPYSLKVRLGRVSLPLTCFAWGLCGLLVLLPISSLAYRALAQDVWSRVFSIGGASLSRSFYFSFIGASILTFLGFLAAYLIKKRSFWCWWLVDISSFLLFAIPGTVLAIGIIQLWNNRWTAFIYGSMWIIIIGYIGRYYFVATRILLIQLGSIPDSMEEAAQLAGAGWAQRVRSILVPLSKRGIVAAWLCTFLFCLRDTDITMLIYPPGGDTLPVRIFTVMANGRPELVAALCLLMVASALIPAALLWAVLSQVKR